MNIHLKVKRAREWWVKVTEAGKGNPSVSVPSPRKWTASLDRCLLAIDAYLDGEWEDLVSAVKFAETGGASRRLVLSAARLSSNDCSRLEELLGGCWESPDRAVQETEEESKKRAATEEEKIRQTIAKMKEEAWEKKSSVPSVEQLSKRSRGNHPN